MRNKQKNIEIISVMLLLLLFSFVVFLVISAGTNAFGRITSSKQTTMSARVALSYISMKVKQNDSDGAVSIEETQYGDALKIDSGSFSTHIFFFDGGLYECLTKKGAAPSIGASNRITNLSGFSVSQNGSMLSISCVYEHEGKEEIIEGTIGIRS